jgi:hypothetical protein
MSSINGIPILTRSYYFLTKPATLLKEKKKNIFEKKERNKYK